MAKIKIRKKELKQDEFGLWLLHLVQWVKEHSRLCIFALILVVVVLGTVKLVQVSKSLALEKTNELYGIAMRYFEVALSSEKSEDREKYFKESLSRCDTLIKENQGAALAQNALWLKASIYYYINDFDRAISTYQLALDKAGKGRERALIHKGLGYCYENKYFYQPEEQSLLQEAIKHYDSAIEYGKDNYIATEAKIAKARLLELQYKNDEAIALLKEVEQDRTDENLFKEPAPSEEPSAIDFMIRQRREEKNTNVFSFSKSAEIVQTRLKGEAKP